MKGNKEGNYFNKDKSDKSRWCSIGADRDNSGMRAELGSWEQTIFRASTVGMVCSVQYTEAQH